MKVSRFLLLGAALALPGVARAQAGAAGVPAVVPVIQGAGAIAGVVRAATSALESASIGSTVSGKVLRSRLGKKPHVLAKKCGTDVGCLAVLGAKAGVTDVLVAHAGGAGGGKSKIIASPGGPS